MAGLMDFVFLIRHANSGLIKIGVTDDWTATAYALKADHNFDVLLVVACGNALEEAERLHVQFGEHRLPESEWFYLEPPQVDALLAAVSVLGEEIKWRPIGSDQPKASKPSSPSLREITWEQASTFKQAFEAIPAVREVYICESPYGNEIVGAVIASGYRWIPMPWGSLSNGYYEQLASIDSSRAGVEFSLGGDDPRIPVSEQEMFDHLMQLPGPVVRRPAAALKAFLRRLLALLRSAFERILRLSLRWR